MAHFTVALLALAVSVCHISAQQGGQGGFNGGGPGGFDGGQGGFGQGQGGFGQGGDQFGGGGPGGQFGGGPGGQFGGGPGGQFGGGPGGQFGGGPGGQFGGPGGQFGGPGGQFGGGPGGQFGGGPGGQFGGGGFPGGPGGFPGGPGGFPGGPGGFPGGPGGFPGFPGGFPGGSFPNFQQNQFQLPQVLTCIGTNEATDQFKVTIRPEPGTIFPQQQQQQRRELQRQTWRISAMYIPAASLGRISPAGTTSLVGQFSLAVTRYGRTDGNCAGLGGILQSDDTLDGNTDPFNQNPYLQAMRNQQGMFGQAAGSIPDPIVISQGGNVYSGIVRDLSEMDLRGRGIGICLDALCQRPTTTCCSIAKDSAPATEPIGQPINTGPLSGNFLAGNPGGIAGGQIGGTGGGGLISGGGTPGGLF